MNFQRCEPSSRRERRSAIAASTPSTLTSTTPSGASATSVDTVPGSTPATAPSPSAIAAAR